MFSAGHDFGDMAGATYDETRQLFDVCTRMMTTVQQMPQVVCAKVHALATAAGCQLVASCDLAVAAESAGFATPGGKGGLFCHTPLVAVARNVGRKRALEMAFTGDPIDAATAAEWGLVNRAVPDAELDAAVDDLMRRATRGSAASKALGKRAFYAQVDMDQAAGLRVRHARDGGRPPRPRAGQEGIAAFLEKRPPTSTELERPAPSATASGSRSGLRAVAPARTSDAAAGVAALRASCGRWPGRGGCGRSAA